MRDKARICKCGCGEPIEEGRASIARYRIPCGVRLNSKRSKDSKRGKERRQRERQVYWHGFKVDWFFLSDNVIRDDKQVDSICTRYSNGKIKKKSHE